MFPATEIGESVSIAKPLKTDTENRTDPTIQLTVFQFKQVTRPGNSHRKNFPIGGFNSGIDVPRSRQNIDTHTGMNPIATHHDHDHRI